MPQFFVKRTFSDRHTSVICLSFDSRERFVRILRKANEDLELCRIFRVVKAEEVSAKCIANLFPGKTWANCERVLWSGTLTEQPSTESSQ